MKRIYILLLVAATAYSLTSCKEKTPSEKFKDKMEDAGDDIKDATEDAGDAAKKESKEVKEDVHDATH